MPPPAHKHSPTRDCTYQQDCPPIFTFSSRWKYSRKKLIGFCGRATHSCAGMGSETRGEEERRTGGESQQQSCLAIYR